MRRPLPSREYLERLLKYDPLTGEFYWQEGRHKGKSAGYRTAGRLLIKIDQIKYPAARLAWMIMVGQDPGDLTIDHIDCNPSNDKWCNLRLATQVQQELNKSRRKRKHDLPKGAYYCKNNFYMSKIVVDVKCVYLGTFKPPEEAHSAYCQAATKHFDSRFWRAA